MVCRNLQLVIKRLTLYGAILLVISDIFNLLVAYYEYQDEIRNIGDGNNSDSEVQSLQTQESLASIRQT